MKKSAIIITFVAAIVMGMSTSALADDYYDLGKSWAKNIAYDFCYEALVTTSEGPGAGADSGFTHVTDEDDIIALTSGCKDFLFYYIEDECPEEIADYSDFKKYVLEELNCDF
ncbi:MAG: hypothetical protein GY874_17555 [Desulfobacteraceae bacterium]|nr:hypothetical protein [Desulfobacteraceae bacterium]